MKIKPLISGILIGAVSIPTIAIGGSFVSSLIAGKTPTEAVQILGEQFDVLIGRVEVVETTQEVIETKQTEQEETILELQAKLSKEEACREADNLLIQIKETCQFNSLNIDECIAKYFQKADENKHLPDHVSVFLERANKLIELKSLYLSAKAQCEQ